MSLSCYLILLCCKLSHWYCTPDNFATSISNLLCCSHLIFLCFMSKALHTCYSGDHQADNHCKNNEHDALIREQVTMTITMIKNYWDWRHVMSVFKAAFHLREILFFRRPLMRWLAFCFQSASYFKRSRLALSNKNADGSEIIWMLAFTTSGKKKKKTIEEGLMRKLCEPKLQFEN